MITIHNVTQQTTGSMNWEGTQKAFPNEVKIIQEWFDKTTGIKSSLHFWKQPIWQNDLLIRALFESCGLTIETDVKWVADRKEFRYIYAVIDDNKQFMEPRGHYATRIGAEAHAYIHCFEWLKLKRQGIESAQIEPNEQATGSASV